MDFTLRNGWHGQSLSIALETHNLCFPLFAMSSRWLPRSEQLYNGISCLSTWKMSFQDVWCRCCYWLCLTPPPLPKEREIQNQESWYPFLDQCMPAQFCKFLMPFYFCFHFFSTVALSGAFMTCLLCTDQTVVALHPKITRKAT